MCSIVQIKNILWFVCVFVVGTCLMRSLLFSDYACSQNLEAKTLGNEMIVE